MRMTESQRINRVILVRYNILIFCVFVSCLSCKGPAFNHVRIYFVFTLKSYMFVKILKILRSGRLVLHNMGGSVSEYLSTL